MTINPETVGPEAVGAASTPEPVKRVGDRSAAAQPAGRDLPGLPGAGGPGCGGRHRCWRPSGPNVTELEATNAPPLTPGHPLGGDSAGRDILSRLIWGSRQTVIAVLVVVVVSVAARRHRRPGGRLLPRAVRGWSPGSSPT